ncbi:MAG: aldehyde dehydrogenase [Balneolaceae bacterium]
MNTADLLKRQRTTFEAGTTRSVRYRKEQLHKLRAAVLEQTDRLTAAMARDLAKPEMESISAEIVTVLDEIDVHLKHLEGWAKPESARANLISLPSSGEVHRQPYGVTLIIGAWNYPVHLVLMPLIGAISGGNTAVVKPSELAPHTSTAVRELLESAFDDAYIAVAEGGVQQTQELLDQPFDKIFFTGSTRVGKIVMEKAAAHLTPVTLELGGKSPAVVHKDADIPTAAKRIIWGKCMNAGQTCIAPDFALVHESVKAAFLDEAKAAIRTFYGSDPAASPDFGRIINDDHFNRITELMKGATVVAGGQTDADTRYIAPTILAPVTFSHPIMKEEIFGPVLPVLTYTDQNPPLTLLRQLPPPLALYLFSSDSLFTDRLIEHLPHGGTCVNDVVMHITNPNLPFGGCGPSGMGHYHGRYSFDCFTRPHAVMRRNVWPDPSFRYPPFGKKLYFLKKLLLR